MMGMGFGLMGAGSAVKGLVSGYQQGRKFAQDEERFEIEKQEAEQRKRLREGQIEGVGLANRKAKADLDEDEQWAGESRQIADLWKGMFPSEQPPGIKSAPTVENKAPAQTLSQPAASEAPPQVRNLPASPATAGTPQTLPATPETQGSVQPMLGAPRGFYLPPRGGITAPASAQPLVESPPSAAVTSPVVSPTVRGSAATSPPVPAVSAAAPGAVSNAQPTGDRINRAAWMSQAPLEAGTQTVNPDAVDPDTVNQTPAGAVYTVDASPDQSAAPKGISPPGGTPIPSRGPSLAQMEEFYSKANAIAIRRMMRKDGPAAAVKTAIDMGRAFSDAKVDAGIRALNLYDGTNDDVVRAEMEKAGLPLPEGTRFERKEVEVIPGTGFKATDVIAISPDGKMTRSLHGLMAARMSPKEIFDRDTAIGKAAADFALKKTAEENLQQYRQSDLKIKSESAAAQANYYLQSLDARRTELGYQAEARRDANDARADLNAARADEARSRASRNALGEIMQLNGISREVSAKDMEMLSDDEKLRVQTGLAKSFTAHTIWSMNSGRVSAAESLEVGRRVALDPKAVKTDEAGQAFIQLGGKQVFVPAPVRPASPGAATGASGADNRPPPAGAAQPAPASGAATPQPSAATQIADSTLLKAYETKGRIGYQEALLGPRPGIRNVAGTNAWDASANQLADRLNKLIQERSKAASR